MRKGFFLIMMVFTIGAVFAIGAKGAEKPRTLHVWTYWDDLPRSKIWYGHMADFEKANPSVKLEKQYVAYNNMKEQVTVAALSGSMPDVIQMDAAWVASVSTMGVLAELNSRFEKSSVLDNKLYFKGPMDVCTWKGKLYAIPQSANNPALYYNKDMFAKAGIKNPPTNWAEFVDAATKVAAANKTYGYCISLNDPSIAVYEFMPYVWAGGGNFDSLGSKGTIDTLKMFKQLVNNGAMSPEVVTWSHTDTAEQFMQGRCGMYQEGPWRIPEIEKKGKFKWGVVPIPAGPAGQATSLGGESLSIGKGPNEDTAWKFVEFTQAPQRALELAVGDKRLPVRSDFLDANDLYRSGPMAVFAQQMKVARARGPHPELPKIEQIVMTMVHSVVTGQATPEAAAAEAAKAIAGYY